MARMQSRPIVRPAWVTSTVREGPRISANPTISSRHEAGAGFGVRLCPSSLGQTPPVKVSKVKPVHARFLKCLVQDRDGEERTVDPAVAGRHVLVGVSDYCLDDVPVYCAPRNIATKRWRKLWKVLDGESVTCSSVCRAQNLLHSFVVRPR